MGDENAPATTRTSAVIKAPREVLYRAFTDAVFALRLIATMGRQRAQQDVIHPTTTEDGKPNEKKMNRRRFVAFVGATSALMPLAGKAEASPDVKDMNPEPVELADGLSLTDYRFGIAFGRLNDIPMLFGEVTNSLDDIYDMPTIVVTFLDTSGNIMGEGRADSISPFVEAGASVPISAEFYDFSPLEIEYDRIAFSIDGSWPSFYGYQYPLPVVLKDQQREKAMWQGTTVVTNDTEVGVRNVIVCGIVRDTAGRYAGYTWTAVSSEISASKTANVKLNLGFHTAVPTDPFQFLNDDNYSVTVSAWYTP